MWLSSVIFSFWCHSFMSPPVGIPRDGQLAKTVHYLITPVSSGDVIEGACCRSPPPNPRCRLKGWAVRAPEEGRVVRANYPAERYSCSNRSRLTSGTCSLTAVAAAHGSTTTRQPRRLWLLKFDVHRRLAALRVAFSIDVHGRFNRALGIANSSHQLACDPSILQPWPSGRGRTKIQCLHLGISFRVDYSGALRRDARRFKGRLSDYGAELICRVVDGRDDALCQRRLAVADTRRMRGNRRAGARSSELVATLLGPAWASLSVLCSGSWRY
jgi:hypothetical protein